MEVTRLSIIPRSIYSDLDKEELIQLIMEYDFLNNNSFRDFFERIPRQKGIL